MLAVGLPQLGQAGCSPGQVRLLCPPSPHTVHATRAILALDPRARRTQDPETVMAAHTSVAFIGPAAASAPVKPTQSRSISSTRHAEPASARTRRGHVRYVSAQLRGVMNTGTAGKLHEDEWWS